MNEITYVTGDATRPQGDGNMLIAHICNNIGAWGSGFVVALSRRSTLPEQAYRLWHTEQPDYYEPFDLGNIQLAGFTHSHVLVANMIAQRGIRHSASAPPAVDYVALRGCLNKLGEKANAWGASVHMPRIGCGLGGGEWSIVEEAILESLTDIYGVSVTVYDLPSTVSI